MTMESPRVHPDAPNALPVGTRLGEYELRSLLGVGGFGIVYLAFDHALEREVAIKEYMPASLAGRTETMFVSLRSSSDAETFALGLKSFVNEAKLLARFDHPSLLKVHRFWEANGTAYMAMPVMRGRTMKEVRHGLAVAPDENWLRALLGPLLGAIERLHSEGVYHRDIAPDNIQIEPDGRPVLLDFGAARRVISDKTQTITAILKPAYAPIEQYADSAALKQGPWTDIYALGATLHYMLLGHPPPPATTRAVIEEASALTVDACPGCSDEFLQLIEWMLAPRPQDRPQSVAALRDVLEGRAPLPRPAPAAAPAGQAGWQRTIKQTRTVPPSQADEDEATRVMPPPASSITAAPLPLVDPPRAVPPAPPPPVITAPPVATLVALPPSKPKWGLILGGVGAAAAVAAGAVAFWPRPAPAPAPGPQAAASAPPLLASAPAPVPVPAPQSAPASPPESAVAAVVLPGTPAPKPAAGDGSTSRPVTTRPPAPQPHSRPGPAANLAPAVTEAPAPVAQPAPPPPEPVRAPVPAPAPSAPEPAAPASPQAACAGKRALAYFGCMERECLRTRFKEHADCVKWRAEARRNSSE